MVQFKLDLSGYSPRQLIELIEEGAVSRQEVVDSKIEHKFFTTILSDYLRTKGYQELNDTVICGRRSGDTLKSP